MANIARWCFQHRFIVIGLWVVALVGGFGLAKAIGTNYSNSFSLLSTDSTKALDLLQTISPGASGETDTIVWHVTSGSVRDAVTQTRIAAMLRRVAQVPQVGSVVGPYASQISRDGRTAYAQVNFTKDSQDLAKQNIKSV